MLKIDSHAHYLPKTWPNLAEKYGDVRFPVIHHEDGRARIYKDGKFFREIWSKTWDPAERIADYARFGVQVQVLLTDPIVAMRSTGVSHTAKQTPPIQLGTSGGWRYDLANGYCCGGTLGSLIQVGGQQRILEMRVDPVTH